ncbi:MAG: type VI secretion system baseplate subunit TssG [Chitinophagaceae bacterium]
MKTDSLPITFFSSLDRDFKAEVIAAEMVEQGTPEDQILIMVLGAMKRPFRKDVESVADELSEYNNREYVVIKTPKEGIYDMLPEGLFHHPSAHSSVSTEKELIKAIRQRKIEERNSRKFFLPFEATINHLRVQMSSYENRLDKRTHYDELVDIFRDHWEIFQYLDNRQADLFLHLIPILHDLRDNHPVIEIIMEMIFDLPVQIILREQLPVHTAEPILSKMGESILGVDLTTGNAIFDEGVDEILIRIGPMASEVFQQFMPGGAKEKLLELLCDYLLPVHLDIITEFELMERERTTRFVEGEDFANSVLGADTYL